MGSPGTGRPEAGAQAIDDPAGTTGHQSTKLSPVHRFPLSRPAVAGSSGQRSRRARGSRLPSAVRLAEIELTERLPVLDGARPDHEDPYRSASVLVRLHRHVLGVVDVDLPPAGLARPELSARVWDELGGKVQAHLAEDGLPTVEGLPPEGLESPGPIPPCGYEHDLDRFGAPSVSVLVATCGRPAPLVACVDSLLRSTYPSFELLLVDNLPADPATAEIVERRYRHDPRVRYVPETTKGLSAARNRGLAEASSEIVIFTDDDIVADRHWLPALVRAFLSDGRAACVTGMVIPTQLETPAQVWFEQYGGFNKGHRREAYDGGNRPADPLYPYAAGSFGTGASMAFRAEVLRSLGGFSPNLGLGTPAVGGEDLDAFVTLLLRGHRLVYEPDAIVRHPGRRDLKGLYRQVRMYGTGLGSMITKQLVEDSGNRWSLLQRLPRGIAFALSPRSTKNAQKREGYPRLLTVAELVGMLLGPAAYLRSRWSRRRSPE